MSELSLALYIASDNEDSVAMQKDRIISHINRNLPGGTANMYVDRSGNEKYRKMKSMISSHQFSHVVMCVETASRISGDLLDAIRKEPIEVVIVGA